MIHKPGNTYEIRAFGVPHAGNVSGYYDNIDKLQHDIAELDSRKATGIYTTVNPCHPDLLARSSNRYQRAKRGMSTSDPDIVRRHWLLVDLDPVRPAGISSTDEEHEAAWAVAERIRSDLVDSGYPPPLFADSGNGYHLMWRVDLPNDDATRDAMHGMLQELARRYDSDKVKVDQTVYNASRIWKAYGVTTRKGDATATRPHRKSMVLAQGSDTLLRLDQMLAPAPVATSTPARASTFDLYTWVSRNLPGADGPHPYDGGLKWVLDICPWNSDHTDRAAYIIGRHDGPIAAGCKHDSCSGRNWHDLRRMLEPSQGALARLMPDDDYIQRLIAKPVRVDWSERLLRNEPKKDQDQGTPMKCNENVHVILRHHPEWQGVLGFDEFRYYAVTLRKPPWDVHAKPWEYAEGWTDFDDSRLRAWMSRHTGVHYTQALAPEVETIARERAYHPVRDYLQGLHWDGVGRVDTWLADMLGADDTPYTRAVGRWWLISAVARVMEPGCKADHVLILEGLQGIGKSTALGILAGEWFTDSPVDMNSKDGYQQIQGVWIVEFAELDSFAKTAATKAKQFFSSKVDKFRLPYGKRPVEVPRQCVFAGSTNDDAYLTDPSGGRRFWPVACTAISVESLKASRDQLWAEARTLYDAKTPHYPVTEMEIALCAEEQEARYRRDPWEDLVKDWLRKEASATQQRILEGCLGIEPGRVTPAHYKRLGDVLRRVGWIPSSARDGGARLWRRAPDGNNMEAR